MRDTESGVYQACLALSFVWGKNHSEQIAHLNSMEDLPATSGFALVDISERRFVDK